VSNEGKASLGDLQDAKLAVIIMAAGKGTRLKSRRPKVLHEIGGKPLLAHVIAAASQVVAPEHIFAVVGHQAELVKAAMASTGVRFVDQTVQRGTGHAVQAAREAIAGYGHVLVLSGDVPLIRAEHLRALMSFHLEQQAAMTLTSSQPELPTGYGRVLHTAPGAPDVKAIVEQKMLSPEQLGLKEINLGLYAFRTAPLLEHLGKLDTNNPHGELYLTDMAQVLHQAGERVVAFQVDEPDTLLGANTIAELVALDATLRAATASRLMAQGVTIFRPETCTIDADVQVGPDTVIEPFVQLLGQTRVGSDCLIRSYSVLENSTLAENVLIRQSCVLVNAQVEAGATIGPFAHLRPGSQIGPEVHIGNFVETKNTKLHKGVKAGHLSYLGDAEIGERTNIGAGVITCNYDGVHKHRTQIGNDCFVGSDSTLVAPVTVENGSYIGAGSCITKTVPADSLAVARSHQFVKNGWATTRRAEKQAKP
jgi:bifunctional UDP-N-acetylglucosamine pyrophosphorylase/glucosamine-1-phosphate N-acetyltransferase